MVGSWLLSGELCVHFLDGKWGGEDTYCARYYFVESHF